MFLRINVTTGQQQAEKDFVEILFHLTVVLGLKNGNRRFLEGDIISSEFLDISSKFSANVKPYQSQKQGKHLKNHRERSRKFNGNVLANKSDRRGLGTFMNLIVLPNNQLTSRGSTLIIFAV